MAWDIAISHFPYSFWLNDDLRMGSRDCFITFPNYETTPFPAVKMDKVGKIHYCLKSLRLNPLLLHPIYNELHFCLIKLSLKPRLDKNRYWTEKVWIFSLLTKGSRLYLGMFLGSIQAFQRVTPTVNDPPSPLSNIPGKFNFFTFIVIE